MNSSDHVILEVTPQVLLKAYCCGIFPMADSADDPTIFWVEPQMRGVLPLEDFHVPRSLAKKYKKKHFDIRINTAFDEVLEFCAEETPERDKTWINQPIRDLYTQLHDTGHCHSVEAWQDDELVGGLYGVAIGGAFFGESMFSRQSDASKCCLVALVKRMREREFQLLDTQFTTPHLEKFGVVEVPKDAYSVLLESALTHDCKFV